jgi:hypothetical protein
VPLIKRKYKFELPLTTEKDLKLFLDKVLHVQIPDRKICADHVAPWRAFCDAYFAKHDVSVWKASRGLGGKSFMLATLGLTEAVTLNADVNILGGSGQQSQRVLEYMADGWANANGLSHLLSSEPGKKETRLITGNKIVALMASQRSVRGPHPQRLRLDEVDEMAHSIFTSSLGQTLSKNAVKAQTVLSSTHHNPDGTMSKVLAMAQEKGWPIWEWCFKETMAQPSGWLQKEEADRKKREMPEMMWLVEVVLQEPSFEGRAIMPEAVELMFDPELGKFKGDPKEYIEIEPPEEGARYAHGTDWAKEVDWTVIVTLRMDVFPARVVAFEMMGRLPWPYMVGRFDKRIERYGGKSCHDATGLGNVINDYLTNPSNGIVLTGQTRDRVVTDYILAIEAGEITSPDIASMKREHKYMAQEDMTPSGHLPDSVCAGALAWMAGKKKAPRVF